MREIREIDASQARAKHPEFRPGDTVRVHVRIREGDKTRVQVFEGVVIQRRRGGANASFTVRKVSYGVGVERIFPFHSPLIEKVEVKAHGRVRRSRLVYLRERTGKAARIRARLGRAAAELVLVTEPKGTEADRAEPTQPPEVESNG
jgi:large subunit ribosomal protein L19